MATNAVQILLSFPTAAATNLGTSQYTAVSIDNTGNIVLATAAAGADGILQNNPTGGDTAAISIFGVSQALLGGTVTNIGDLLEVGTAGALVEHATGVVVAKALQTGASGNVISVLQQ